MFLAKLPPQLVFGQCPVVPPRARKEFMKHYILAPPGLPDRSQAAHSSNGFFSR